MLKSAVFFVCLFAAVYSFAVEGEEAAVDEAPELERAKSLPHGAVCDPNKDSCQCYGKWHRCDCPWFGNGSCVCQKGYKGTCIEKLSCPNKKEWGLDWRSEESERSPC